MLIQADALSKRYGALTALDGCSLSVRRGEVFGLLGPNGSGKTTLLRILLGMLRPTSGSARIDGLDCYREAVAVHRRLSYLPGDARMGRNLTGRVVLEFFAHLHPAAAQESALALAERLKLDLSRRVGQMSTGMRQKLALALALAPDVPLVVLDEPTSNLDPSVRSDVLELLREARDAGRAVLFSSHVLAEAEEVCDRVAVLREGKVAETIELSQLKLQHRITAQLAGELVLHAGALAEHLHIERDGPRIRIQTERPLPPLLGWLAEQPLEELRIEPLGLRTIYEKHHPRAES